MREQSSKFLQSNLLAICRGGVDGRLLRVRHALHALARAAHSGWSGEEQNRIHQVNIDDDDDNINFY